MTVRAYTLIKEYQECFDYYLHHLDNLSDHQKETLNKRMRKLDAQIIAEAQEAEGISVYAHRVNFLNA